jgi:vitamin B12 transporter
VDSFFLRALARQRLGFCLLLAGTNMTALAQDDSELRSGTVVITATRTPELADQSLSAVAVIDSREIARRQALSLQELFQGEAGIQINNNGGLGKVSSVYLRGTEAEEVLVLVDGIRMGSVSLGTTAFQYVPVDQIDHIEIVRGPRSSVYGSEAIGGVIQIFTRGPADGFRSEASAARGSHSTQSYTGALAGKAEGLGYSVAASYLDSDGYPNCRGIPYPPGGGCYVLDPTPDGYHNASGSARLRYDLTDEADVEASVLHAQGGTRYAGLVSNHEDFIQQAVTVGGHWSPVAALKLTVLAGRSRDEAQESLNLAITPGTRFDTTRDNASVQADWHLAARQLLSLGSDYLRDQLSSDTPFPVTSRRIVGVFGIYQGAIGREQWSVSARHDKNQQFGERSTGSLAWGHRFDGGLKLMASYGSAFRAPSFDDLYFPGFGNPALRAETSRTAEVGIDQRLAAGTWSLHAFETRVHDLIGFDANFVAANTDEARIRGIEAQDAGTLGAWHATLTAGWLDPRNRTRGSPNYDNLLPGRARATAHFELAHESRQLRIAGRVNVAGPRFNDLANTAPLGGYGTVDLLVEWRPTHHWSVQGKAANLTDRRYELTLYYPQDRRNYLLSIRYTAAPSSQP